MSFIRGLGNPFELHQGGFGLISGCDVELGIPLEFEQGSWASSQVETGNSGLLSSCSGRLRVPVELQLGTQGYTQALAGISGFLSVWGRSSGFISSFPGLLVKPYWDISSLARMCRVGPFL